MNLSFENQVALVTGAGSGIGLATASAPSPPSDGWTRRITMDAMKDILRDQPIGRLGWPEEIAAAVLAAAASAFQIPRRTRNDDMAERRTAQDR
jgi:NAD(P)-dependent dehydrogenase (short-subunit alcohol dehydrogenase family)